MEKHLTVLGILVADRPEVAPDVQRVITDFGECILGRFGVPDPCGNGLITLVMECDDETCTQLKKRLQQIDNVSFNHMSIPRVKI